MTQRGVCMRRRRRKQKTPEQQRRRANRRQRFFHAVGRILFIGILVAAAILALTIFFKVNTISVEGAMRYSAEEIVTNMDVREGDNLYLWNKVKVSNALMERLPYLESVQIRRHLPDTLVVTVTECEAAVAVSSGTGYVYLSRYGKVLEQNASDGGLPVVTGVTLPDIQPGQAVAQGEDAYCDALLEVLQTLDAGGMLDGLRFINLQDLTDVRIGYEGRFDIQVGSMDELSYRLRFAKTVIDERLSPSDVGRLYWDTQDRLHFVPDTEENVAASATGVPTESEQPVNLDDSTGQSGEDGSADTGSSGASDGEISGDSETDGINAGDSSETDNGDSETGDETAE